MVDWNNETTIGTPAADVIKILLLQRRADVFEAYEDFIKKQDFGSDIGITIVKSRLMTYFLELQAYLKRQLSKKEYDKLVFELENLNERSTFNLICTFNEVLDNLNITKMDTRKRIDATRVTNEDESKGL